MNYYLFLFNGTATPWKEQTEWGFDGPVIGPIHANWSHGALRLSEGKHTDNGHHNTLKEEEGYIRFDGSFYGDYEIMTERELTEIPNAPRLSYDQFVEKNAASSPSNCTSPPESETIWQQTIAKRGRFASSRFSLITSRLVLDIQEDLEKIPIAPFFRIKQIKETDSAFDFLYVMGYILGASFHPDTPADTYGTDTPVFTWEAAQLVDEAIERITEIFEKNGSDIYTETMAMFKHMGFMPY